MWLGSLSLALKQKQPNAHARRHRKRSLTRAIDTRGLITSPCLSEALPWARRTCTARAVSIDNVTYITGKATRTRQRGLTWLSRRSGKHHHEAIPASDPKYTKYSKYIKYTQIINIIIYLYLFIHHLGDTHIR